MAPLIEPLPLTEGQTDRGRMAAAPGEIPWHGWWDVLWRVHDQLDADNVSIVAGGLALFSLLAVFPSLAATVAIYGLVASPDAIAAQVTAFRGLLPEAGVQILERQLLQLVTERTAALGIGAIVAALLALWSARKGMVALITAMNVAYNESDRRSFFGRLALSLGLTVAGVLMFVMMLLIGVAAPFLIGVLPLGDAGQWVLLTLRWGVLWVMAVGALAILYRFAPHRCPPQWRWVSPGAVIAATLWILGSLVFAVYVRSATSFGETYGAIGGVVILLLWFYVSSYVVIVGAEINSELERQTTCDSTIGDPKPMGKRGAFSADTVGPQMRLSNPFKR